MFGEPVDDTGKMFSGDVRWVDWINECISRVEPRNPHRCQVHANLTWLLQCSEVRVMSGMWERLMAKGIPFLATHDDILCRKEDKETVHNVMKSELKQHFTHFEIAVKEHE